MNHQLVYYEGQAKTDPDYSVDSETPAQYPAGADDVQRAREWVHDHVGKSQYGRGDRNRVVLLGHSSGGAHIAMNLYAQGRD
jgi:acetyl esterase/lipase